jgi:hypothetical protein
LVAEALERVGSAQSLSLLKSWALSEDPRDKLSVVWRADRAIEAIIRRDALELGGALSAPKDGERVGQLSNSEGVGQLSTTDDP